MFHPANSSVRKSVRRMQRDGVGGLSIRFPIADFSHILAEVVAWERTRHFPGCLTELRIHGPGRIVFSDVLLEIDIAPDTAFRYGCTTLFPSSMKAPDRQRIAYAPVLPGNSEQGDAAVPGQAGDRLGCCVIHEDSAFPASTTLPCAKTPQRPSD